MSFQKKFFFVGLEDSKAIRVAAGSHHSVSLTGRYALFRCNILFRIPYVSTSSGDVGMQREARRFWSQNSDATTAMISGKSLNPPETLSLSIKYFAGSSEN